MFRELTSESQLKPSTRRRLCPLAGCLACLFAGFLLTGCFDDRSDNRGTGNLEKFSSHIAFQRYVGERYVEERARDWWYYGDYMTDDMPLLLEPSVTDVDGLADSSGPQPEPGAPQPLPSDGNGQADADYSTTNLQEEGVDEADVVKNDGEYLYILTGNTLKMVRAVPADDMAVMSAFEVAGSPSEMYLRGDSIILVGRGFDYDSRQDLSVVTIVDVMDRASPVIRATIDAQASLVSSRLIGGKLHLVVKLWPSPPVVSGLLALNWNDVDALIPDLTVTLGDGDSYTENVIEWYDVYYTAEPDGYMVTAVVTVDVDSPDEPTHSVGVMANVGITYASTNSLYITDTEYNSIDEQREGTQIYQFDFEEDGAVFVAGGSVPGRLLNRFSLGEYGGHLRTATTMGNVNRWGVSDATNNVYVLHPDGGELKITGKIEDIAPTEKIYSARFVGQRGFLVTFKKVDPLFTLDLSDPTSPRVVGELKVPGYSDYIYPLGENHLLTIGKDAVDMGTFAYYQGVQLSLFDVTDFADPQRTDVEIVGVRGSTSEALSNPHAFNFFAPVETLAVPMRVYEGPTESPSQMGTFAYEGLCLYRVNVDEGIERLGAISTGSPDDWSVMEPWRYYGRPDWTRGIFIGDAVYAVTSQAVQALPLDDLAAEPYRLPLQ
ncbi:MAG: beta-propeller domain-containing protein [Phycisphaerales bacterium]|nr:MAG: beta-propeller domain-containing protein [Phycisphaerales bacterium]